MAWTTPRTWVDEELIDATILNTHIRDNLNYLKDDQLDNTISYKGVVVIHEGNTVTI